MNAVRSEAATHALDADRIALLRTLRQGTLLPKLMRTYIDEAARHLAALQEAAAAADCGALAAHAHGLKSASFNVGANEVGEWCAQLEAAGRESRTEHAASLVAPLADAFARTLPLLQALT
jgi:HPt (histidine-containing phosphotransfer) domain-containing protein